ncbi:hypothetical protein BaRGS_00000414 [Batillaria attramentaria]|uniref:Uncharacterized protein n=1 Tax=Batillaria attramentaria TaxID=370345 RepID=A0ABD0M8B3_9CAEN
MWRQSVSKHKTLQNEPPQLVSRRPAAALIIRPRNYNLQNFKGGIIKLHLAPSNQCLALQQHIVFAGLELWDALLNLRCPEQILTGRRPVCRISDNKQNFNGILEGANDHCPMNSITSSLTDHFAMEVY